LYDLTQPVVIPTSVAQSHESEGTDWLDNALIQAQNEAADADRLAAWYQSRQRKSVSHNESDTYSKHDMGTVHLWWDHLALQMEEQKVKIWRLAVQVRIFDMMPWLPSYL